MNVYIDGLGYSEDPSTRQAMQVIKAVSLSMGRNLDRFGMTSLEAAEYLEKYFGFVFKQHGSKSIDSIDRVFSALKQWEEQRSPGRIDCFPSWEEIRLYFEAYQRGGKLALLTVIEENQKQSRSC